jgi:hypothetical protein
MKVTVFVLNPRELFRVYEGVSEVSYRINPDLIQLFDKKELIAEFGLAHCWAVESERATR